MTPNEERKMIAAEAVERRLCHELKMARDEVTATTYATPEQQRSAQETLCRAMLTLDKTRKQNIVENLLADVKCVEQKLEFLDKHVVRDMLVFDRLMGTGVSVDELVLLNEQDGK